MPNSNIVRGVLILDRDDLPIAEFRSGDLQGGRSASKFRELLALMDGAGELARGDVARGGKGEDQDRDQFDRIFFHR